MIKDRYKYRVWCKNKNSWEDDFCFITPDGRLIRKLKMADGVKEADSNHVVVFYTGLKDKNGKLIYEGDIVKIKVLQDFEAFGNNEKYIDMVGQVIFNYGGFFIEQAENDIFLGQMPESELEVIGNIYENPELLKEKK